MLNKINQFCVAAGIASATVVWAYRELLKINSRLERHNRMNKETAEADNNE